MNILVINCGSSSLKYQLIDGKSEKVLAKGICERIGISGGLLTHQPAGRDKIKLQADMPDHTEAVRLMIEQLTDTENGVISSLDEIAAVGHRIVHGGEKFVESTIITDEVIAQIESCNDLAPLHNPANLIGVNACRKLMPKVPMTAVFDTAFHQTMPEQAYLYGIPYRFYKEYGVRRYGFHGTSHKFVSERAAEILGRKKDSFRVIVCHLGNGASVSAVKDGKSIDTSMGLTPLEGLIMGTRSGDIDPSILQYVGAKEGKNLNEMIEILNKESGVLGLSDGLSSDFRDLDEAWAAGNQYAGTALETYAYRVGKYIGAYTAAMNGVDAIVFTAGAGENNCTVRKLVCKYVSFLGITIDEEKNKIRGEEVILSTPESKVTVMVVPTNEELAIARDTVKLILS
jgi:acetate kinase